MQNMSDNSKPANADTIFEPRWTFNSDEEPFWKQAKGPIEVEYLDGTTDVLHDPKMKKGLMPTVKMWRPWVRKEKIVRPQFERGHQLEDVRLWTPSWKERFLLLFGFKVMIGFRANTEHRPGKTAIGVFPQLTAANTKALKYTPTLCKFFISPPKVELKHGVPMSQVKSEEKILVD